MLLGFQKRFAPMVKDHSKFHTLRAKRKRRPKVGETCHNYTNLRHRTKKAELLGRHPCTRVQDVEIRITHKSADPSGRAFAYLPAHRFQILIDGVLLSPPEAHEFAWRDGFRTKGEAGALQEMAEFWRVEHDFCRPGQTFSGDLIHWDPTIDRPAPGRKSRKKVAV